MNYKIKNISEKLVQSIDHIGQNKILITKKLELLLTNSVSLNLKMVLVFSLLNLVFKMFWFLCWLFSLIENREIKIKKLANFTYDKAYYQHVYSVCKKSF